MPLGPIMMDVRGLELSADEREKLAHPLVGGVILFSRNYHSPAQLQALTAAIHALRTPPPLIAVDQEGGRVQRFREGFTRIPPMRELGGIWDRHPNQAKALAHKTGFVLASELRACGVDFSFTPVLDLDYGQSGVIGDRAFHRDPQAVAELAHGLMQGLKQAGMAAVGKHFPGHGFIRADSHLEMPVDERGFADIELEDLLPFRQMIDFGLAGIMPAHVVYPRVDDRPAGFSPIWLKQVLRRDMSFDGALFSDDLSMEGAAVAGGIVERAEAALTAGCDMVLVCNDPAAAERLLDGLRWQTPAVSVARLVRMHGRPHPDNLIQLHERADFVNAVHAMSGLGFSSAKLPLPAGEGTADGG